MCRNCSSLKESLDHIHIIKHIISLSSLVSIRSQEIEQKTKETDTDIDEIIPEGTRVASDSLEGM